MTIATGSLFAYVTVCTVEDFSFFFLGGPDGESLLRCKQDHVAEWVASPLIAALTMVLKPQHPQQCLNPGNRSLN